MSQQMIDAVVSGDFERVKQLVILQPNLVNAIGRFQNSEITLSSNSQAEGTALVAAILNKKQDIAKYLLRNGAKVEAHELNKELYSFISTANFNANMVLLRCNVDTELLKLILMNCRELNPSYYFEDGSTKIHVNLFRTVTYSGRTGNRSQKFNYYFYEAVLRNDSKLMQICLTPREYDEEVLNLGEASFLSYIDSRKFTMLEMTQAIKGIESLVNLKKITHEVAKNIKTVLYKNVSLGNELADFPQELQDFFKEKPTRNLFELFAELQAWLYPEEKLPKFLIYSEVAVNFNLAEYEKTTEEIRYWQDPVRLRDFLNRDITSILARLNFSGGENVESPAIKLFAEIIYRFCHEKIKVNEQDESLLNKELQHKAILVLHRFYSMLPTEKIILDGQRAQVILLNETRAENSENMKELQQHNVELAEEVKALKEDAKTLKEQNVELKQDVKELKQQNAELLDTVKSLNDKFERLLLMMANNQPLVTQGDESIISTVKFFPHVRGKK